MSGRRLKLEPADRARQDPTTRPSAGIFESVLIPPAVAREISPSIPVLPTWMRIQAPSVLPPAPLPRRRLGDGEWEALALAIELKADWIILDDLPARRSAEATGLNVIGTLGTLVTAKRAGLLKSIRPELDALLRTSFFLSPQLYNVLLRAAGEIDL